LATNDEDLYSRQLADCSWALHTTRGWLRAQADHIKLRLSAHFPSRARWALLRAVNRR